MLADADKPNNKETISAVTSLTPQPPMLMGNVIENSIIGENTKKAK